MDINFDLTTRLANYRGFLSRESGNTFRFGKHRTTDYSERLAQEGLFTSQGEAIAWLRRLEDHDDTVSREPLSAYAALLGLNKKLVARLGMGETLIDESLTLDTQLPALSDAQRSMLHRDMGRFIDTERSVSVVSASLSAYGMDVAQGAARITARGLARLLHDHGAPYVLGALAERGASEFAFSYVYSGLAGDYPVGSVRAITYANKSERLHSRLL